MAKMQQCYYSYYVHKSLISAWTIWDRCATFRKMKMNNLMSNDTFCYACTELVKQICNYRLLLFLRCCLSRQLYVVRLVRIALECHFGVIHAQNW